MGPLTCVKTSRAAPPHCPDCSARSNAPSSTMPPRAQFTTCTPRRHLAKVLSFRSPAERGNAMSSEGLHCFPPNPSPPCQCPPHTRGGGQQRRVHRDEVAAGPDLLQRQLLHAEGGRGFGGDDGVIAYGLRQSGRLLLQPGTVLAAGPGGVQAPHHSSLPRLLTFMPKACMRVATSLPMRPSPSTPSVFPFSSMPMY